MKSVALVLVVAACTHHRPLREASEVEGSATIVTLDHEELEVTAAHTTAGTEFRTRDGLVIEAGNVESITDARSLRGAFEGFGIGGGIGIVAGAVIGYADGDDPPCSDHGYCFRLDAGEKAVGGGILFGVLAGVVGLAIGAVRGSQFVYDGRDAQVVTPVGPPGSVAGLSIVF